MSCVRLLIFAGLCASIEALNDAGGAERLFALVDAQEHDG
jgi:hypothetical protein